MHLVSFLASARYERESSIPRESPYQDGIAAKRVRGKYSQAHAYIHRRQLPQQKDGTCDPLANIVNIVANFRVESTWISRKFTDVGFTNSCV